MHCKFPYVLDAWYEGFVEYQGRCLNDKGVAEYDQDNDYEEYKDNCCESIAECWNWCKLQQDGDGAALNWPTFVACEWDSTNEYCHIYGEATIVGGDGDPTKTCLAANKSTTIFKFYYY